MNLLTEVGKALLEVIKWVWMTFIGLCDFIGISELVIISLGIAVITFIIGKSIYKGRK